MKNDPINFLVLWRCAKCCTICFFAKIPFKKLIIAKMQKCQNWAKDQEVKHFPSPPYKKISYFELSPPQTLNMSTQSAGKRFAMYIFRLHLVLISGMFIWHLYLASTTGISIWRLYVALIYGIIYFFIWRSYQAFYHLLQLPQKKFKTF